MLSKNIKYSWAPIVVYITIFYLCCVFAPSGDDTSGFPAHFDKFVHFIMYLGLTMVSAIYYIHDRKGLIDMKQLMVWAFALPVIYGGLIEIVQDQFVDKRSGDWLDFLADILGSIFGILIVLRYRSFLLTKQLIKNE